MSREMCPLISTYVPQLVLETSIHIALEGCVSHHSALSMGKSDLVRSMPCYANLSTVENPRMYYVKTYAHIVCFTDFMFSKGYAFLFPFDEFLMKNIIQLYHRRNCTLNRI